MPITRLARPILPDRLCVACGQSPVRLTLMTDYGRYLACDACGRAWHEERAPLYAFDVTCPNGHAAVQQLTEAAIRKGAVRCHCHHCGARWTSTHEEEARMLRHIAEHLLHPELAIG